MKLEDANYKSHWNHLGFCDQWKMMSNLNVLHRDMSDFVSFPLFRYFSHKIDKFWFWKSLKYFIVLIKKDVITDLNMSYFVSIEFALVIKPRSFDFESHWNTFSMTFKYSSDLDSHWYSFFEKIDVRFEYVLSNSVWFGFTFIVWVEFWR